jgi:hypothetical protein
VAVAGKTGLTGLAHHATRESERVGERFAVLMWRAQSAEREWARTCEGNGADRLAPSGRGRERARTWVIADRWDPPVRQHGRARPGWAGLAVPKLVFL